MCEQLEKTALHFIMRLLSKLTNKHFLKNKIIDMECVENTQ